MLTLFPWVELSYTYKPTTENEVSLEGCTSKSHCVTLSDLVLKVGFSRCEVSMTFGHFSITGCDLIVISE